MRKRIVGGVLAVAVALAGCGSDGDPESEVATTDPSSMTALENQVESVIINAASAMESHAEENDGSYPTLSGNIQELTAEDNFLADYGFNVDADVSVSVGLFDEGKAYYLYATHPDSDLLWRYDSTTSTITSTFPPLPEGY